MPDVQMTIYCAAADRDMVADTLWTNVTVPLHVRDERVLGRDFGDAHTAEQVKGTLKRVAIDFIIDEADVQGVLDAVSQSRRGFPVRWHMVAVAGRGRIA